MASIRVSQMVLLVGNVMKHGTSGRQPDVGQDGTLLWVCQADPTTVCVSSERCQAALSAGCAYPLELWGVDCVTPIVKLKAARNRTDQLLSGTIDICEKRCKTTTMCTGRCSNNIKSVTAGQCVACALVCLLTERLQSDDFILAQSLAGLIVCKSPWVEKPALDAFPEAQRYNVSRVDLYPCDLWKSKNVHKIRRFS